PRPIARPGTTGPPNSAAGNAPLGNLCAPYGFRGAASPRRDQDFHGFSRVASPALRGCSGLYNNASPRPSTRPVPVARTAADPLLNLESGGNGLARRRPGTPTHYADTVPSICGLPR